MKHLFSLWSGQPRDTRNNNWRSKKSKHEPWKFGRIRSDTDIVTPLYWITFILVVTLTGWQIHLPPPCLEFRNDYRSAENVTNVPWNCLVLMRQKGTFRFGRYRRAVKVPKRSENIAQDVTGYLIGFSAFLHSSELRRCCWRPMTNPSTRNCSHCWNSERDPKQALPVRAEATVRWCLFFRWGILIRTEITYYVTNVSIFFKTH